MCISWTLYTVNFNVGLSAQVQQDTLYHFNYRFIVQRKLINSLSYTYEFILYDLNAKVKEFILFAKIFYSSNELNLNRIISDNIYILMINLCTVTTNTQLEWCLWTRVDTYKTCNIIPTEIENKVQFLLYVGRSYECLFGRKWSPLYISSRKVQHI